MFQDGIDMSEPSLEETLVETLNRVLVPVQPTDVFRDHLRQGLQLASHQQRARGRVRRRRAINRNTWWIGVAAFGASLAAGSLIAYLLRSRVIHPRLGMRMHPFSVHTNFVPRQG
jgi:hypothetical protein